MRHDTEARAVPPCLTSDMSLLSGVSQQYGAMIGRQFHSLLHDLAWNLTHFLRSKDLELDAYCHVGLLIAISFYSCLCMPIGHWTMEPRLRQDHDLCCSSFYPLLCRLKYPKLRQVAGLQVYTLDR